MMLTIPLLGVKRLRSIELNCTPKGPMKAGNPVTETLGGLAASLKTLIEPGTVTFSWSPSGWPKALVVRLGRLPLTWMLKLDERLTLKLSAIPLACGAASSPPLTMRAVCWLADAGPG